jgi:hypothetical protein
LNDEDIFIDEKYVPFVFLFDLGLSSLLLEEHKIILSISKEKIIDFIKKEVFFSRHVPTFVEIPADSWVDYYIEIQLTSIIEEAERLSNEQDMKKIKILHRLDADMLMRQSDKFRDFLSLLSAYTEGQSIGEINGQQSAIVLILENRFGQLSNMICDTIYSINEIDQVREVLEGALSCESIFWFENLVQRVIVQEF